VQKGLPVTSDLELASHNFYCLSVAITGTNGKTTTAELVACMLTAAQRKTVRAGASGLPVCSVGEQSRNLDFLTLDLNSFQLESVEHFRPSVAVITNLRGDHMNHYANLGEFARAVGRVFKNQQVFDWAIVQSEALAHLRALGIEIPGKVITFSSSHRRADVFLDRGLLISSLPNWSGPLFNMEQCALRGPHNAENVMAALAVGRVLHLRLEDMIAALKSYTPGPHRLETVATIRGVTFINNSKAMNVDALQQSIEALPPGRPGEPNIWLIAGGKDKGLDYHDLGPLLARRVKGALVLGEAREKLRAAWSLFTPCTAVESLLEAVSKAAESAAPGDIVLLSPACSSFDMFRSYQHRGEEFRAAVEHLEKSADLQNRALASAEGGSMPK
jgi:UDP-N-acetylmuramoylalanine--D-glutamate ligase